MARSCVTKKTYASLEAGDEVFDIGLNRAVTLIAEKIAQGPSGRRFGADPGKPLGEHPSLGGDRGQERPLRRHVTAGGVNATIRATRRPRRSRLRRPSRCIDERAAKGGGKPKRGAKKAAPKKAAKKAADKTDPDAPKPAKKAAAKKAAAKPKSEAVSKARGARSPPPPRHRRSRSRPQDACEEERGQGRG